MDPIAGKYTYFQRLLHKFKARRDIPFRRKFFIGYDLHGNTYWEFTVDGNMQRLRRKLEPYNTKIFKADYFSTVPPQWLLWLRRTRNNPPSLQELINDQLRQDRIKILAQQADNKWHEEKLRLENEQQLKLKLELDRAKQESASYDQQNQKELQSQDDGQQEKQEIKKESNDPWVQADSSNSNPIQSATLKPRSEDPWSNADKTKYENPINSASIKPRS